MSLHKVSDAIAVQRGVRLKQLREMAGLTSDALAQEAGLSRSSVSYWENSTYHGLSHKGAERVVEVFQKKGVNCSVEWLLLGLGAKPSRGEAPHTTSIHKEIGLFTSLYGDAIVMQVAHSKMEPFMMLGDYVGGLLEPLEKIWKHISEENYIVQTDHAWDVRRFQGNLLAPNSGIQSIAKIIRIWRE